jgi:uncharacterized cofD-like protein
MGTELGQGIRAVVIGGGTGSFTVLQGLKNYIGNLTAIVNMVDDGGSTGVLRDELGVLPPGDIRQCIVALSTAPQLMRDLMNYRFENGTFAGHAFGNLLLSALEKTTGSFENAIESVAELLSLQGKVVPVTTVEIRLGANYIDSTDKKQVSIIGQENIDNTDFRNVSNLEFFITPYAKINKDAVEAIEKAELIIFAPGNFVASILPTLLVDGMTEILVKASAKKIMICNLVTKPGHTDNYTVDNFVEKLEEYICPGFFEYVIYNNNIKSDFNLLRKYLDDDELSVEFDLCILVKKNY